MTAKRAFRLDEKHGFKKVSTSPRRGAHFCHETVQKMNDHSGPFPTKNGRAPPKTLFAYGSAREVLKSTQTQKVFVMF